VMGGQDCSAPPTPVALTTPVKATSVMGFVARSPLAADRCVPSACSLRQTSLTGRRVGEAALTTSPPFKRTSSGLASVVDDSASVASFDGDGKTRVKTAAYWLNILTIDGGFSGKKFTREVVWAQECITREIRAGKGATNPEALCNTTNKTHSGTTPRYIE
jgi:hypothetical protein